MNSKLKNVLKTVFSAIISLMAIFLTACFMDKNIKLDIVSAVLIALNIGIMAAQYFEDGTFSTRAHDMWIKTYFFFIMCRTTLDGSPFAGLLDNDVTRRLYKPSEEERESVLVSLSVACWIIVTLSYSANVALDYFDRTGLEDELVAKANVEAAYEKKPNPDNSPEIESSKPFLILLREMSREARKMRKKSSQTAEVEKACDSNNETITGQNSRN
jgi:hypothetical protein